MKILIIGNEGYIGPLVTKHLRESIPKAYLAGYDIGYFAHNLTTKACLPEKDLNVQFRGDVRLLQREVLEGYDKVIYLGAISNDPMGNQFEQVTTDINFNSAIRVALIAREAGVSHFVFASSCSVYGTNGSEPRTENAELNPLTAYARSKVNSEIELEPLASPDFVITCLRFATACGFSQRLRLDLVLNDFVASAIANHRIEILSDGSPWRPLIHVKDMARAIHWATKRSSNEGGDFLVVNIGSEEWNYQIKDLALAVQEVLPNVDVSINEAAEPDKRSYKVDFSLFKRIAPDHNPMVSIHEAIQGLYDGLTRMGFEDKEFRKSDLIRLNVLRQHIESQRLNLELRWVK